MVKYYPAAGPEKRLWHDENDTVLLYFFKIQLYVANKKQNVFYNQITSYAWFYKTLHTALRKG